MATQLLSHVDDVDDDVFGGADDGVCAAMVYDQING